jgi:hypothetical protein
MNGDFVIRGTWTFFGSLNETLKQLVIWGDVDNEVIV